MPGNKYPSLDEIKNSRLSSITQKLTNGKEPDRFARALLEEKKGLEFPNAIADPAAPETSRSVSAFYADGKKNAEANITQNVDVKFTNLFKQYGNAQYVGQIVDALTKKLDKKEIKFILENEQMLHKQIKDNLGANTTVPFFIDFVENLVETKSNKFGQETLSNSGKKQLVLLLDAAKAQGLGMAYDGMTFSFPKPPGVARLPAGFGPNGAHTKEINKLIKEIKVRNPDDGALIVNDIVSVYTAVAVAGNGFSSKRRKKFIHRPKNLTVIRGGGAVILNPQEKVSHKVFTKDKTFYELNKYIIDANQLKANNVCDIRYALNGKKVRSFKCQNDMKDMIIDLCNETFSLSKYGKLKQGDKDAFLKFCENAHVDVGMSNSIADAETQYKVYEGELDAGNPAPMMMYLFDSFSKGKLSKPDYLNSLNEIYKSK